MLITILILFVLCLFSVQEVRGFIVCSKGFGKIKITTLSKQQNRAILFGKTENKDVDDKLENDLIKKQLDERFSEVPKELKGSSPVRKDEIGNDTFKKLTAFFAGKNKWRAANKAVLAGIFIAGIGAGVIL